MSQSTSASLAAQVWRPSTARRVVLDGFAPVPRGASLGAPPPLTWPVKDPADVLDYVFDVSAALVGNDGDRIASISVTIVPGNPGDLAMNSVSADGPTVVLWLAGGQSGTTYSVQITLSTTNGRTLGRSVFLPVQTLAATSATTLANLTDGQGVVITDQTGAPVLLGG